MMELLAEPLAYEKPEATVLLHISASTLDRMIKNGELRVVRIGKRRTVIPRAELERLLGATPTH